MNQKIWNEFVQKYKNLFYLKKYILPLINFKKKNIHSFNSIIQYFLKPYNLSKTTPENKNSHWHLHKHPHSHLDTTIIPHSKTHTHKKIQHSHFNAKDSNFHIENHLHRHSHKNPHKNSNLHHVHSNLNNNDHHS